MNNTTLTRIKDEFQLQTGIGITLYDITMSLVALTTLAEKANLDVGTFEKDGFIALLKMLTTTVENMEDIENSRILQKVFPEESEKLESAIYRNHQKRNELLDQASVRSKYGEFGDQYGG